MALTIVPIDLFYNNAPIGCVELDTNIYISMESLGAVGEKHLRQMVAAAGVSSPPATLDYINFVIPDNGMTFESTYGMLIHDLSSGVPQKQYMRQYDSSAIYYVGGNWVYAASGVIVPGLN